MAMPNRILRTTTSMSTGQMVRLAVRWTGFFIMPVMFATASTPASARTICVKAVHRGQAPSAGSSEMWRNPCAR